MFNLIFILNKCRIFQLNRYFKIGFRYTSSKDHLNRSSMFKLINKQTSQDSGEIINIFNDSHSIHIPKSVNAAIPIFYYENETIGASLNERGTIDLSSNMHANLPKPPNEALNLHERPYDSIVSLGENCFKNDKFISEELLNVQQVDNLKSRNQFTEEDKLALYSSNEKRFNISFSSNAIDLITQGIMSADAALEYQIDRMKDVKQFWLKSKDFEEDKSYLQLFLPYTADDRTDINISSFLELYNLLDIDGKMEDIIKLHRGQVTYSYLVDKVDIAVRKIVNDWMMQLDKN